MFLHAENMRSEMRQTRKQVYIDYGSLPVFPGIYVSGSQWNVGNKTHAHNQYVYDGKNSNFNPYRLCFLFIKDNINATYR